MRDDDADLHAVRAFIGARATGSADDLAQLRQRILDAPARRGTRVRHLVPVAAALLVLALAGGVAVLLGGGRGDTSAGTPTGPVPAPSRGAKVDLAACLAELAAAGAGAEPVTVRPGELLRLRIEFAVRTGRGDDSTLSGQVHEQWLEPEGMIVVRDEYDGVPQTGPKGESQAELSARQRESFIQTGPGPGHPTPGWLGALPSDPEALLATLRSVAVPDPDLTGDAVLWATYQELLLGGDPFLPPGVRTALFTLMGRVDGLTASEVTIRDRRLIALRPDPRGVGHVTELLLDPSDGRVAGTLTVDLGTAHPTLRPGEPTSPPAARGESVDGQWLHTFQVVPG